MSDASAPGSLPDAVLLNGEAVAPAQAGVSVIDRGLHFGDGLFETIACRNGPQLLQLHRERLLEGCARLCLRFEAWDVLAAEIRALAAQARTALIKVILTRGAATARGYGPSGQERASRIVLRYQWPAEDPSWARDGVAVRLARMRLGENRQLAGIKHLNRLELVLARAEWSDPKIAEALLFSRSGALISGTMSNVFLVHANRLLTPRMDRCGVAGVMRRALMEVAVGAGTALEERTLGPDELKAADEVFLTNARIGIWPVRAIGARAYAPGPLTRRLRSLLATRLERGDA